MIPNLTPPLLILGCHRSGTSAVTGLLHEGGGLVLGDVLPPTKDNPRGYFESMAVVAAHRNILLGLRRDWTCPPTSLAHPDHADRGLAEALEPFAHQSQRWGVKDPRLLFLLPAWLDLVGSMQFVGVIRNPGSIAKSIIKRDGLPEEFAHDLVAAYIERLANLHRALPFPIIDFGGEPTAVLERIRTVAMASGLEWNDQRAREFYSPSLIHHQSAQSPDANYHYLLEAASQPITDLATYEASQIAAALESLGSERAARLPDTYGLRFKERRRAQWREILDDPDVESVIELIPERADGSTMNPLGVEQALVRIGPGSSVPRQITNAVPATHILGTGILDRLDDQELHELLVDLDLRSRTRSRAIFDGFAGNPPSPDVPTAVTGTSWKVDRVEGSRIVLSKDSDEFLRDVGSSAAERHLLSLDARLSALERAAATQREATARRSTAAAEREIADLKKRLQKAEKQLAQAERRYDRLVNRRSVKLALKAASPAAGIFKWRRSSRSSP